MTTATADPEEMAYRHARQQWARAIEHELQTRVPAFDWLTEDTLIDALTRVCERAYSEGQDSLGGPPEVRPYLSDLRRTANRITAQAEALLDASKPAKRGHLATELRVWAKAIGEAANDIEGECAT